ncbi:MAG: acyl carrier protein [Candidatus Xenobium sp.]|jgi:acyl carrier protein
MNNMDKYIDAFVNAFSIEADSASALKYQAIPAWDSVGHMSLIAAIEDAFGIMMDTDDIIEFESFQKGKEILSKNYAVAF